MDSNLTVDEIRERMPTCLDATFKSNYHEIALVSPLKDSTEVYNLMIRETMPRLMDCENLQVLFNEFYGARNQERMISESDCSKYQYGKFKIIGDTTNCVINRTSESEKSILPNGETSCQTEVIWINDCDYQSIILDSSPDNWFKEGDTLTYKLLGIREDTLRYELIFNNMSIELLMKSAGNSR